jgi:hypothetical protein
MREMASAVVRYTGPWSWTGAQWAANLACVLAVHDCAPIHVACDRAVTLDDVWNGRRARASFRAFSEGLSVKSRSVRLPASSLRFDSERVFVLGSAGHASIRDAQKRGPVIVHTRFAPLPACVSLCEDPIVPEDAYDIHVHLEADLTAAFFGRLVDLPALTGVPALARFSPVRVPPFANDPEPRRITIVRGAGFLDKIGLRGNIVIHSELRLPRISPVTLALHERLIRSALRTLQALQ